MKNIVIGAGCLLASISIFAQGPQTYKGEIIDSQCASLGGHQVMEQKGESSKDCTSRCVNMGGHYTLFDATTKTAYQLDDQKKSAAANSLEICWIGRIRQLRRVESVSLVTNDEPRFSSIHNNLEIHLSIAIWMHHAPLLAKVVINPLVHLTKP